MPLAAGVTGLMVVNDPSAGLDFSPGVRTPNAL